MTPFEYFTLAAFALAQIADVVTTMQAMKRGAREMNPVIRAAMDRLGNLWPVAKLAIAGGAVALIWHGGQIWPVWIITAIVALIAWRNHGVQR